MEMFRPTELQQGIYEVDQERVYYEASVSDYMNDRLERFMRFALMGLLSRPDTGEGTIYDEGSPTSRSALIGNALAIATESIAAIDSYYEQKNHTVNT
jgi:hypothetical protein